MLSMHFFPENFEFIPTLWGNMGPFWVIWAHHSELPNYFCIVKAHVFLQNAATLVHVVYTHAAGITTTETMENEI